MTFDPPLIPARLIRRYKRFLADVRLPDTRSTARGADRLASPAGAPRAPGGVTVVHCPNPGAMTGCAPADAPVWLSHHDDPRRKLAYTWELVDTGDAMICVNTMRANDVVAEALAGGGVPELAGYADLRREVQLPDAPLGSAGPAARASSTRTRRRRAPAKRERRRRIDFALTGRAPGLAGPDRCYVEVKSVTLAVGGGAGAFPDAVTVRGTAHLRALTDLVGAGHRAVLLYCVSRTDVDRVSPADDIDPVYGQALRDAARAGVEVLAYRCRVRPDGMWLDHRVPVILAD